ncbi:Mu transposase C-terminal domain-containing protein [Bacillaceae bacterium S4-13-58]
MLKRADRKVKLDGTITIDKRLYEVPSQYIGQKIEVRMDEQSVYIFENGKKMAKANPVTMHDSAHVKRGQSPFAVSEISQEEESDHV